MNKRFKILLALTAGLLLGNLDRIIPSAHAVSFTVDLTTVQVNAATWKWNQEDPTHATFATVNLFGQSKVRALADEWENQRIAAFGQNAARCQMWGFLSAAEKDSVCSTIGEPASCVLPGC